MIRTSYTQAELEEAHRGKSITLEDIELSFSYRTLAAMHNLEPWAAAFHQALNRMHEDNAHGEIVIKVVDGEVKHVNVTDKNKF